MTATGELVSALDVLGAIDQLRRDLSGYHGQLKAHDDLQRHCDNQRMRIGELERLYAGAKAERDEAVMAYGRERARANVLMGENARLRDLCAEMYHAARLLDANRHIEGMRVTDERREDWERRMGELGVES